MNYCNHTNLKYLSELLAKYGMQVKLVEQQKNIPGSFWGDSEAGLIENVLYVRHDTPLHSALHETCHYICMDEQRRNGLHTDAGGDYAEENGVCYLQILLSDYFLEIGKERMFRDMDDWGYSFRLGNTKSWFYQDAEDAIDWLVAHNIVDPNGQLTWCVRQ